MIHTSSSIIYYTELRSMHHVGEIDIIEYMIGKVKYILPAFHTLACQSNILPVRDFADKQLHFINDEYRRRGKNVYIYSTYTITVQCEE